MRQKSKTIKIETTTVELALTQQIYYFSKILFLGIKNKKIIKNLSISSHSPASNPQTTWCFHPVLQAFHLCLLCHIHQGSNAEQSGLWPLSRYAPSRYSAASAGRAAGGEAGSSALHVEPEGQLEEKIFCGDHFVFVTLLIFKRILLRYTCFSNFVKKHMSKDKVNTVKSNNHKVGSESKGATQDNFPPLKDVSNVGRWKPLLLPCRSMDFLSTCWLPQTCPLPALKRETAHKMSCFLDLFSVKVVL